MRRDVTLGRVRLWWDVDCGRCGETSELLGFGHAGEINVTADLKEHGWKYTRKEGWVCPTCNEGTSRRQG